MKMKEPTVLIQEYYITEGKLVYVMRKIGAGKWEKILTPYDKVPYIIPRVMPKEEAKHLLK